MNKKVIEDGIEYKINEYSTGTKYWYLNNKLHRENGPAIEYIGGYKAWLKYGIYHRTDGPAQIYPNGLKYYFFKGEYYFFKGEYYKI